ncbi:hypothetical protein [Azospirillum palustre]
MLAHRLGWRCGIAHAGLSIGLSERSGRPYAMARGKAPCTKV